MQTLTFDFEAIPVQPAGVRRVPVKSHLRRVRGDGETPAPYAKGSETSQAAAEAIDANGSAATGRGRILAALVKFGPMTDGEIIERTGMSGDTVRPRRLELAASGLIRKTGEKRKTRAGRPAEVWEAVG